MRCGVVFSLITAFFLTGFQAPQKQENAKPIDPKSAADVYALYSLVMQPPRLSHTDGNQTYLIADSTSAGMNPAPCIQVDPQYQKPFDEILAEYAANENDVYRLDPSFKASKPYKLLTAAEAEEVEKNLLAGHRIPGSQDLIRLSNVYFSRNHKFAVVSVSAFCGQLCGMGTIALYQKGRNGQWSRVRLTRPQCLVIS